MPAAWVSFWNAADRTAIAQLDQLELAYIPSAGQKFTFAPEFNSDSFAYRVSHVEHILRLIEGEPLQMVDVFLSPDTQVV